MGKIGKKKMVKNGKKVRKMVKKCENQGENGEKQVRFWEKKRKKEKKCGAFLVRSW